MRIEVQGAEGTLAGAAVVPPRGRGSRSRAHRGGRRARRRRRSRACSRAGSTSSRRASTASRSRSRTAGPSPSRRRTSCRPGSASRRRARPCDRWACASRTARACTRRPVRGDVRVTRWRIDVTPFAIEDPAGRVDGEVFLRGDESARTARQGRRALAAAGRAALSIRGRDTRQARPPRNRRCARLPLRASPSRATCSTSTPKPRAVGTLRAMRFDGSPWLPPGRMPEVSGSIAVDAGAGGIGVDGTLTSPAAGAEAIRVHGSARYRRRERSTSFDCARGCRGPARRSRPRDRSASTEHAPRLAIAGEWTALRWPLTGDRDGREPVGLLPTGRRDALPVRAPHAGAGPGIARGECLRHGPAGPRPAHRRAHGRQRPARHGSPGPGRLSFHGDQAWQATVDGRGLDLRACCART